MPVIDDFKSIAEDLPVFYVNNKAVDDAVSRTSIGRYYYYIFLKYREAIHEKLSDNVIEKNELYNDQYNIHSLVKKTIKNYLGHKVSIKLNQLRDLRNACDYEMSGIINNLHVKVAIIKVQYLESKLFSICAGDDLDDAFISALNDIKNYRQRQQS
ncbi:MAG: hypothetical protein HQK97_07480 [Nitrospirae bacterium]|nr:hypothetical protein [Nitrospirota bacterium]